MNRKIIILSALPILPILFLLIKSLLLIGGSDFSYKNTLAIAALLSGWVAILTWMENIRQNTIANDWRVVTELLGIINDLLKETRTEFEAIKKETSTPNGEQWERLGERLYSLVSVLNLYKKKPRHTDINAFCDSVISKVKLLSLEYKNTYIESFSHSDYLDDIENRSSNIVFLFLLNDFQNAFDFYRLSGHTSKYKKFLYKYKIRKILSTLKGTIEDRIIYSI